MSIIKFSLGRFGLWLLNYRQLPLQIVFNVLVRLWVNRLELSLVPSHAPCWCDVRFRSAFLHLLAAVQALLWSASLLLSWVQVLPWRCSLFHLFSQFGVCRQHVLLLPHKVTESLVQLDFRFLCTFASASFLARRVIDRLQFFLRTLYVCLEGGLWGTFTSY